MVLKYMTLDTGLVGDEAAQPARPSVKQEESASPPSRKVRPWLLLVANVVVWILVYSVWVGKAEIPLWGFLTANRGMVTGIMYNPENPCAIVHGEVVHEGDTVRGYKVVKIRKDEVEFEKNGETLTKQVQ